MFPDLLYSWKRKQHNSVTVKSQLLWQVLLEELLFSDLPEHLFLLNNKHSIKPILLDFNSTQQLSMKLVKIRLENQNYNLLLYQTLLTVQTFSKNVCNSELWLSWKLEVCLPRLLQVCFMDVLCWNLLCYQHILLKSNHRRLKLPESKICN